MKKIIFLCFSFSVFNAIASNQCLNSLGLGDDACKKCTDGANLVVKATKGAKNISNIEPLVTWRASCAEKPPVGVKHEFKLLALCDGELISQNGSKRSIFYWMYEDANYKKEIGYHLCPTIK